MTPPPHPESMAIAGDPSNFRRDQGTIPRPGRLFSLPKGEEGAGRPHPHQGDLQEGVGGGHQNSEGGRLRHGLQALDGALQKMY